VQKCPSSSSPSATKASGSSRASSGPDDSALKRVEKEGALAGSGGAGGQRPRSLQKMEGQSRPSEW
jgi:hypothetical protein